jgi:hypothetical protein
MAYTPNPDREVVNGKAKVSAKELADFQKQYGSDKTLRDLLNMDKGLVRRKDPGESPKKAEDIQSSTDKLLSMSRQSGPPKPSFVEGVKAADQSSWDSGDQSGGVKPKNRSSWDSTFGEDAEAGFKKAARGDSPLNDAIMGAGKLAIAAVPVGRALSAVRPAVGAAVKYMTKKDSPISKDVEPELFTPGMKRPDNLFGEAAARDFKKGGRISLDACKVSTHKPAKKNPNF